MATRSPTATNADGNGEDRVVPAAADCHVKGSEPPLSPGDLVNRLFDISLDLSGIAERGDERTRLHVAEVIGKLDALVRDVRAAVFERS